MATITAVTADRKETFVPADDRWSSLRKRVNNSGRVRLLNMRIAVCCCEMMILVRICRHGDGDLPFKKMDVTPQKWLIHAVFEECVTAGDAVFMGGRLRLFPSRSDALLRHVGNRRALQVTDQRSATAGVNPRPTCHRPTSYCGGSRHACHAPPPYRSRTNVLLIG